MLTTMLEEIDRDFAALVALCESSEAAEEEQLECALQEARCLAKEQVRRTWRHNRD